MGGGERKGRRRERGGGGIERAREREKVWEK